MRTLILASSLAMVISLASSPALGVARAIAVSTPDENIANTSALDDLKTDPAFAESYQTSYPVKSVLSTDVYGNKESEWQGITMAAVKAFAASYFYFYHPLCSVPKWTNASTGESSLDVAYRVSMSVTGSLGSYSHYPLTLVNHSADLRFWKFRCDTSFAEEMAAADYRAFEISELELTNVDGIGGSNAYTVGKRFAWTKGAGGAFTPATSDLETITISPRYDYFRIYGKNGHADTGAKFPSFDYKWVDGKTAMHHASGGDGEKFDYSQTDIFYVTFPVRKTYGELVGADLDYKIRNEIGFYGWFQSNTLGDIFDQDYYKNMAPSYVTSEGFGATNIDPASASESKTIRLSTGADSDYVGLETLTTSVAADQYPDGVSRWWNDRTAWCLGYADQYSLATVQKLAPIAGADFVKNTATTGYEYASTNPYAISPATNDFLAGKYAGADFVANDYYILRFEMRDASMYDVAFAASSVPTETRTLYGLRHYSCYDVDVMDLHFYKAGKFYTIGVVADSGDIVTGGEINQKQENFSFSWRWLLLILGGLGLIAIIWVFASAVRKAGGGKKDA